ncbi:salicylate hydroxylase [Humitalea rosea]|uniref:Salicylate hydroxylase n=1 Tax=Humitalea rosea TaxID=990373 RepID=A0A2W7IDR6_9PROT|nr:FAD-dependent monooxygenase [Humitalea rosea]PZW43185.1 salicylate hydroxylase [Humitalea rosea]
MRIGIIGTGVAGSLLAESLLGTPGVTVAAFERAQIGEQAEAGTGLNLGPNAAKALRLHLPERHAALRAASLDWRRWQVALTDGTPLLDLDLLELAEEPGLRIRWSELYRLLRAPVAGCTQHGHALEAIEEDAVGRLVPVFRVRHALLRYGGFDLLVGADGRYSQTRALTAGEPEASLLGVCVWRLLVTAAEDCPFDDYTQWFQGNARLLAFRVPGGAVYIAGTFPLGADGEMPEAARSRDFQRALFTPEGAEPCPAVAWMLAAIERQFEEIHWARSATIPLLRSAAAGRVLLLGDAAQAMVPTLGQGATQAVEDGVIAGAVLAAGGNVAAARDARVNFVRQFSEEASDTLHPGTDPVAGTRAKDGPAFRAKLRRLYTDVPAPSPRPIEE